MHVRLRFGRTRLVASPVSRRHGCRADGAEPLAAGDCRTVESSSEANPHHLPARRRQPVGNLGPQAEHRHRRAVPPIPTSVPGIHISELLPYTARQMHHLSIVRSINSKNNDHGVGHYEMTTGRRRKPHGRLSSPGAVAAKVLTPAEFALPGHILIKGGGSAGSGPAYLGPKFAAVELDGTKPPPNAERPTTLSEAANQRRQCLSAPRTTILRPIAARPTRMPIPSRMSRPSNCCAARCVRMSPRSRLRSRIATAAASSASIVCWRGDCWKTAFRSCK